LESLEDRTVMSIVFNPHFGNEVAHAGSSPFKSSPPVELIFWGSYWNNSANSPSKATILNEAQSLLSSSYLWGTGTSYGTANSAYFDHAVPGSGEPANGFSYADLTNQVHQAINANLLPDPDNVPVTPIYVVITPPGVTSDQGANVAGYHVNRNTDPSSIGPFSLDADPAPIVWAGLNSFGGHSLNDSFTDTLSHELAETMTDPSPTSGVTVTPAAAFAAAFPSATGKEIGDNEPGYFSYGYRVNGVMVQPYWAQSFWASPNGTYLVEDGNWQIFTLDPQYSGNTFLGTYALTVDGDQGGPADDTITVATSASGGVAVTLNGGTATFDPGVITGITIQPGGGTNSVTVESTLYGVPVTISDTAGSINNINISPAAQFLDNIQGNVTIYGAGFDTLTVYDQNDPFSYTYTTTASTMTRTASAVITDFAMSAVTLDGGKGAETYDVNGTGAPLTLNAGIGNDTVYLGTGDLDYLAGHVTVNGQGGSDSVYLQDQGVSYNDTYAVSSTTVTRAYFGGLTYGGIASLTLDAENGNNVINVGGTAYGTTTFINAGSGSDTIALGQNNLDYLQGPVVVDGHGGKATVSVQDEGNPHSYTYTITGTTVTRPSFGGLTYKNAKALVVFGSYGQDTFNILSSLASTPITLYAGTGNHVVNVGSASSPLDAIQGALNINGQAATVAVNINDQASTAANTYTLTGASFQRPGFGGLTYAGIARLTINAETGLNSASPQVILVQGTAAGVATTINATVGYHNIGVGAVGGSTNSLSALRGPLTINGLGWTDNLTLYDTTSNAGRTYTFGSGITAGTNTIVATADANGLAPGLITYGGLGVVVLYGTNYNDTCNVASLPYGTAMVLNMMNGQNTARSSLPGASTWLIYPPAGGAASVAMGRVTFGQVWNIQGGPGADDFVFMPQYGANGGIGGSINGGGGGDTLDYSHSLTAVNVNLGAYGNGTYGSATGVGGTVANIQNVIGSPYNDVLTGNVYGNVLVGGGGNDVITGGTGRSILIGGTGGDTIQGRSGNDLIIGGYTSYDLNPTALDAIFAEWDSSDSFAQRVQYLSGPVGHLNGGFFLIPTATNRTVFDDGAADTITDVAGNNWIIPS
jgi:hypothetical protein